MYIDIADDVNVFILTIEEKLLSAQGAPRLCGVQYKTLFTTER